MLPSKKDFIEVKVLYKKGSTRKVYAYGLEGLGYFLLCTKLGNIAGVWVDGVRVFGGDTIWYWTPQDYVEYQKSHISIGPVITEKEYKSLNE